MRDYVVAGARRRICPCRSGPRCSLATVAEQDNVANADAGRPDPTTRLPAHPPARARPVHPLRSSSAAAAPVTSPRLPARSGHSRSECRPRPAPQAATLLPSRTTILKKNDVPLEQRGGLDQAADAIATAGEAMLQAWAGYDAVVSWIDALPPAALAERPRLQASWQCFPAPQPVGSEALAWYAQAEIILSGSTATTPPASAGPCVGRRRSPWTPCGPHRQRAWCGRRCACPSVSPIARRGPGCWSWCAGNKLNVGRPPEPGCSALRRGGCRDEGPRRGEALVLHVGAGGPAGAVERVGSWRRRGEIEHRAARGEQPDRPGRTHRGTMLLLYAAGDA